MTGIHEFGEDKDSVLMFSASLVSLEEEFSKFSKVFGIESSKGIYVLGCDFEGNFFLKLDTLPWRVADKKPKVNIYDRSIPLNQDISIVPVLNLQKIADQRISHQCLHEF